MSNMIAHIFLIASICILLSEGISFFDKRQEGEHRPPSEADFREQEAKWRAEREREKQERCMAANLTNLYQDSVRPCGEALAELAQDVIRVLKAEGPKAAQGFIGEVARKNDQRCKRLGEYFECCYVQGDCTLLQNDLPIWIAKAKSILDDLEDVQVIDVITMFATMH